MEVIVKGEAGLPLRIKSVLQGLCPPNLLPFTSHSTLDIWDV